jgi:hypothetical protein
MCKRGLFTNHRLVLGNDGRINCEKCHGLWDLDGRELLPYGFDNWAAWLADRRRRNLTPTEPTETHWSDRNPLTSREVARVLVQGMIRKYDLRNRAEVKALRDEASHTPELFIDDVLGRNQP